MEALKLNRLIWRSKVDLVKDLGTTQHEKRRQRGIRVFHGGEAVGWPLNSEIKW